MEIVYKFEPEELRSTINLIVETFSSGSAPYKTGRGKRLFEQKFSGRYDDAENIISRCKRWYFKGLRKPVTLTSGEVLAMRKLAEYCMEL